MKKNDFRDGDIFEVRGGVRFKFKSGKERYSCIKQSTGFVKNNINDDLTNNGSYGTKWDIVKVYRLNPDSLVYELFWKRKKEVNKKYQIDTKGLQEIYDKHDVCKSAQRDIEARLTEIKE